jgi:hypothetical protein
MVRSMKFGLTRKRSVVRNHPCPPYKPDKTKGPRNAPGAFVLPPDGFDQQWWSASSDCFGRRRPWFSHR